MAAPIILRCPLCERYVSKIEQARDYGRPGQNVTVWHHGGDWCFVVDDLRGHAATPRPSVPFAVTPVKEPAHARA